METNPRLIVKVSAILAFLMVTISTTWAVDPLPNSALDRYLRALQLTGGARSVQLHVRQRGGADWRVAYSHPWSNVLPAVTSSTFETAAFTSFNSSHPHGQNDGALWQGRGINSRVQLGWESHFRSLSWRLHPEFTFAQNAPFPIIETSRGDGFGNYRSSPDVPQRFGESALLGLHTGDSEVSLHLRQVRVAVGTPQTWIGPTQRNAIMLSTHAPPFPRLSIGLEPTETRLGTVQVLLSTGLLRESDYFDADSGNNGTSASIFHFGIRPSTIPGFTLSVTRMLLATIDSADALSVAGAFLNPSMAFGGFGTDDFDQRASIAFDWRFPSAGFGVYGEWARNDYSPGYRYIVRAPEHSHAYTLGVEQVLLSSTDSFVHVVFELTQIVNSFDYLLDLGIGGTFYSHSRVRAGHTNDGQILGAGIGSGAAAQYLGVDWYHRSGSVGAYINRHARDQDYLYGNPANYTHNDPTTRGILRVNVEMAYGIRLTHWFGPLQVGINGAFLHNLNWNWEAGADRFGTHLSVEVSRSW